MGFLVVPRDLESETREDMQVNMSLYFRKRAGSGDLRDNKRLETPVYVSPFVGGLDDRGENGMDLVKKYQTDV